MNKIHWEETLRWNFEVKIPLHQFLNLILLLPINLNKRDQNEYFQKIFHKICEKKKLRDLKTFSVECFTVKKFVPLNLQNTQKQNSQLAQRKRFIPDIRVYFFQLISKCISKSRMGKFQPTPLVLIEFPTFWLLPWKQSLRTGALDVWKHHLRGAQPERSTCTRLPCDTNHIHLILKSLLK